MMSDYFLCVNCDNVFPDGDRAVEVQQAMCNDCANVEDAFYSSYGGSR